MIQAFGRISNDSAEKAREFLDGTFGIFYILTVAALLDVLTHRKLSLGANFLKASKLIYHFAPHFPRSKDLEKQQKSSIGRKDAY